MGKKYQVEGPEEPKQVVLVRGDEMALFSEEVDRREVRKRYVAKLRLLWLRRAFLFRITMLGLIASLVIALLLPNRYTATARLMPPDEDSSSTLTTIAAALAGSSVGNLGGGLFGLRRTSDIFIGILSSRTTQDQLIEQLDLKKVYGVRRIEDARRILESRTNFTIDRKSQIITISVVDASPRRADTIASGYVQELDHLVASLSTSSARRERIFLADRLQHVQVDLESAEKEFGQFASKNTAINITEQGKAMVGAAATLQGELIASQSELEGLRQIYTDQNVKVRTLTARVAELKKQLNALIGQGNPAAVDRDSGVTYPSIRQLPILGVSYEDLLRQTKVEEAVFETLTKEYETAKVQEAKEIPTVQVLDPPEVPGKKSFPPRLLITFLGTMLSGCLAIFFVLWSAHWKAIDPHDPGKLLVNEVFDGIQHWSSASKGGD
jgi:uncharacterized protein involved in exopolysaccharide biosynthesis